MKRYVGTRTAAGCMVVVMPDSGAAYELEPRRDVRDFAPAFNWGTPDLGAAQLAFALCMDALDGNCDAVAPVHIGVKYLLVAKLHGAEANEWYRTVDDILAVIWRVEGLNADRAELPTGAERS